MSSLSVFGLVAVSLMLICYALEDRSPWFVLAFAGACLMAAAYGFMQGAWPFGIVEAIWSVVAVLNWRKKVAKGTGQSRLAVPGGRTGASPSQLNSRLPRKCGRVNRSPN